MTVTLLLRYFRFCSATLFFRKSLQFRPNDLVISPNQQCRSTEGMYHNRLQDTLSIGYCDSLGLWKIAVTVTILSTCRLSASAELLVHTFSHQVSPTMRHQYLVQFRLFLPVFLVDGIPLSSCRPTVYRYFCGIFLDDISTREQFAFVVYCYRV